MTTPRCSYCGADPAGELDATVAALQRCNNCRLDIRQGGQWTGIGWGVIQALIAAHGQDAVEAADARTHAAAVERADAAQAGRRVTIGEGDIVHILAGRRVTLCGRRGDFHAPLFDGAPACLACERRAGITVAPDGGRVAVEVQP